MSELGACCFHSTSALSTGYRTYAAQQVQRLSHIAARISAHRQTDGHGYKLASEEGVVHKPSLFFRCSSRRVYNSYSRQLTQLDLAEALCCSAVKRTMSKKLTAWQIEARQRGTFTNTTEVTNGCNTHVLACEGKSCTARLAGAIVQ